MRDPAEPLIPLNGAKIRSFFELAKFSAAFSTSELQNATMPAIRMENCLYQY